MWDPQWPALTAVRDAVRLDLRGFGESDRPPRAPSTRSATCSTRSTTWASRRATSWGPRSGPGSPSRSPCSRPEPVRSLLLAPPGGSLLTERTPAFAAFAAAENEAMARGDLDAAVEANVDAWVVGERRTSALTSTRPSRHPCG